MSAVRVVDPASNADHTLALARQAAQEHALLTVFRPTGPGVTAAGGWPDLVPQEARNDYDLAAVKRWLGVFLHRFIETSQFKWCTLPNGPKVGSGGSLSPRGDWRAPSDAARAWLDELDGNVPDRASEPPVAELRSGRRWATAPPRPQQIARHLGGGEDLRRQRHPERVLGPEQQLDQLELPMPGSSKRRSSVTVSREAWGWISATRPRTSSSTSPPSFPSGGDAPRVDDTSRARVISAFR